MDIVSPQGFWEQYKAELTALNPTQAKYHPAGNNWTKLTKKAAIRLMESRNLQSLTDPEPNVSGHAINACPEYFRVDVIGDEKVGRTDSERDCNWLLRIAFEHENPGISG